MKNKKLISLLGGAAVLSAMHAMPANAASSVTIGNKAFDAVEGKQFTTTIYVTDCKDISDLQTALKYDRDTLELVSAKPVNALKNDILINDKKDGRINISVSFPEAANDTKELVELTFLVKEDLGTGSYPFLVIDDSAQSSASSYKGNGIFDDIAVDSDFSKFIIYSYGDANIDGMITTMDVTLIKQLFVDPSLKTELNAKQLTLANVNNDYADNEPLINGLDAFMVLRKTVQMDSALGGRAYIDFFDNNGNKVTQRSVPAKNALNDIPEVPAVPGLINGKWSLSPDELIEPDFDSIEYDTEIYAIYDEEPDYEIYKAVQDELAGIMENGKALPSGFTLPYLSGKGKAFNMTGYSDDDVYVTWSADLEGTDTDVIINPDYSVLIPEEPEYTTWITLTAGIKVNKNEKIFTSFVKPIKGKIDVTSSKDFESVIDRIPKDLPEHYRLPGYISLEASRAKEGAVKKVQNIDIRWTVVRNSDGTMGDERAIDPNTNEICYLKKENNVTIKAEFIFKDTVVYDTLIERTIPAQPLEKQLEYANDYISSFVPSVVSGECYLPKTVPLYDFKISWISSSASDKIVIGSEEKNIRGTDYQVISVGKAANFMEWGKLTARLDRAGDDPATLEALNYDVQLAGNSTVVDGNQIPDTKFYKSLVKIFDEENGNNDGILTEEELYDADTMAALNYRLDFSYSNIKSIKGAKYLRYTVRTGMALSLYIKQRQYK